MFYVKKEDGKIVGYVQSSTQPDGYEPSTEQEIQTHKQSLLPQFVSITVPLAVFQANTELQQKLSAISLMFSDIKRKPDGNGNLIIYNINLDHVRAFLTAEEHAQLTAVDVIFDEKINALFITNTDDVVQQTEDNSDTEVIQ